jgi:uncharacterized protein HemY
MFKKENLYIVFGLVLSFVGLFSALALPLDTAYEYVSFDSHGEVTQKVNIIGVAINVVGVFVLLYGLLLPYFSKNNKRKSSLFKHVSATRKRG